MRAAFAIAGLILAGTTQALAQPQTIVLPEPFSTGHVPGHTDPDSFQEITSNNTARTFQSHGQIAEPSGHPITLGPLSMDIGNADIIGRDGKRAHYAHIELEGVQVMGGNVSGNFDGRAATLHLNWHFGQ